MEIRKWKEMQRTLEKEQLQFKELIVTLGKRVEAYSKLGAQIQNVIMI